MLSKDFKYKHITKLPWIVVFLWTLLLAWFFEKYPLDSYFDTVVRLFLFGVSYWLLLELVDRYAVNYRKKILLKIPEVKDAYIGRKLGEIDKLRKGEEDEE